MLALTVFLTDITEWGWPEAPARKLPFRDDNPKLPQVLPRYLPVGRPGRRRAHIAAAVDVDRVGPGDEDAGRAQLPDVLAQSRSLRESLQHGRGVLSAERGGVR